MTGYFLRHIQVFLSSLGQLARSPGSTLMTVCAIGITLALPTLLYLLVNDVESITRNWEGRPQISVFLNQDVSDQNAADLADELSSRAEVGKSQLISSDEALAEFKRHSDFGMALEILEDNPLPASIVLHIQSPYDNTSAIENLVAEIDGLAEVDFAQWDVAWVKRLHLLLNLAERAVTVLAVLLVLAVVVIISNTVRLSILNKREEIEIMKLIGATERFIRRPFLYSGAVQGLLGALLAGATVAVCIKLLEDPVAELVVLYHGDFSASGIDLRTFCILLLAGSSLGWLAARAAVGRYLSQIEPE